MLEQYSQDPHIGNKERRELANTPGYDAWGYREIIPPMHPIPPSSRSGCLVIALGASLALGSFGTLCSFAKGERNQQTDDANSPLVLKIPKEALKLELEKNRAK